VIVFLDLVSMQIKMMVGVVSVKKIKPKENQGYREEPLKPLMETLFHSFTQKTRQ